MSDKQMEKFTVMERMLILNYLPKESNFQDLKILRKLREALSFDEAEHRQIGFRNTWKCGVDNISIISSVQPKCPKCQKPMDIQDFVTWDARASEDVVKEVFVGNRARQLICNTLVMLSNSEKLPESMLDIYDRFVEAEKKGQEEE